MYKLNLKLIVGLMCCLAQVYMSCFDNEIIVTLDGDKFDEKPVEKPVSQNDTDKDLKIAQQSKIAVVSIPKIGSLLPPRHNACMSHGGGSQEVELATAWNEEEPVTAAGVFDSRTKYLPDDLRQTAWRHFEQQDNLRKGLTIEEASNLAKLYNQRYSEHLAAKALKKDGDKK